MFTKSSILYVLQDSAFLIARSQRYGFIKKQAVRLMFCFE